MQNLLNKSRMMAFTFLALFFSLMCVLTLLRHAWAMPSPEITPQKPLILGGIAAFEFLLIIGIHKIALSLSSKPGRKFVSIVLAIYAAVQVVFIFLFPLNAYEDAAIVERYAREILHGDFSSLGIGHYLGYYPNNIGITLFFAFLYSFLPKGYITLRLCNVVFTTISAWLIYKLYKELMPEEERNAYGVLLLTVLFVPAIILNNFTYGDIIAAALCLAAMLNAVRFVNRGGVKYAVYTAVLLMLGNFIRRITLLFLLAILLYWFVRNVIKNRVNWKKTAAGILLAVAVFNLPLQIFSFIGMKTGMLQEPVGVHANPVWRWINIGFPSEKRLGYWDGGRNTSIFLGQFMCDSEKASKFFIDDIIVKYKNIGVKNTMKGYAKKTFWLWTEGTYTVNFYGLSQAVRSKYFAIYNTPLVKYIEPQDKAARVTLDWLLHAYNWIVLALIVLYLVNAARRRDYRLELFVYVIILYIGFYFLWEVKSRYLFGLYPVFMIMAYNAVGLLYKLRNSILD